MTRGCKNCEHTVDVTGENLVQNKDFPKIVLVTLGIQGSSQALQHSYSDTMPMSGLIREWSYQRKIIFDNDIDSVHSWVDTESDTGTSYSHKKFLE